MNREKLMIAKESSVEVPRELSQTRELVRVAEKAFERLAKRTGTVFLGSDQQVRTAGTK